MRLPILPGRFTHLPASALRTGLVSLAFAVSFLTFESFAVHFQAEPGKSLWLPSSGLSLAFLILFGPAYAPLVAFTSLASGLWIAGSLHVIPLIGPAVATAGGAALAAWLYRRQNRSFHSVAAPVLAWIIAVAVGLSAWTSLVYTVFFTLYGLPEFTPDLMPANALHEGLAHLAGILTVTPPLLLLAGFSVTSGSPSDRRAYVKQLLSRISGRSYLEMLAEGAGIAVCLLIAVHLRPASGFQYYFCSAPVLWIAMRHGLHRTTLGILIINIGITLSYDSYVYPVAATDVQLFMIMLAITGFFLGCQVDERHAATEALDAIRLELEQRVRNRTAELQDMNRDLKFEVAERWRVQEQLKQHLQELWESRQQLAESTSELVVTNERLSRSERILQEMNESKDVFFSIISHDLRGPLATVLSLAQVLEEDLDELPPGTVRAFISDLRESASQTFRLLENLLDWARLHNGALDGTPSALNLREMIEQAFELLEPGANAKNIRLIDAVPVDLTVYSDHHMLYTVLRNLISNGIKFTRSGGEVAVSACRKHAQVSIFVRDNGVGIRQQEIQRLFRLDGHFKTRGTADEAGSGLGLILCHDMVERMGGTLHVESTLGEGTTFYFTLLEPPAAYIPKNPSVAAEATSMNLDQFDLKC